jgi:transposase-like protein
MSKLVTKSNGITQIAGRKSRLTPEFIEGFCKSIETVFYVSVAAKGHAINENTVGKWLREAQQHEKQSHPEGDDCTLNCGEDNVAKRTFARSLKRAQAKFQQSKLELIADAGKTIRNWPANAWLLERTDPDNFGMRNRTDVNVKGTVNHKHSLDTSHRAKLLAIANKSQQLAIETTQDEDGVYHPVESE